MFEELATKEYLVIVLLAVLVYLLLAINPETLQNKNYQLNGNPCPNAGWHALVVLVVGTLLYLFVNRFVISRA